MKLSLDDNYILISYSYELASWQNIFLMTMLLFR
jgi:hypothetical protein